MGLASLSVGPVHALSFRLRDEDRTMMPDDQILVPLFSIAWYHNQYAAVLLAG